MASTLGSRQTRTEPDDHETRRFRQPNLLWPHDQRCFPRSSPWRIPRDARIVLDGTASGAALGPRSRSLQDTARGADSNRVSSADRARWLRSCRCRVAVVGCVRYSVAVHVSRGSHRHERGHERIVRAGREFLGMLNVESRLQNSAATASWQCLCAAIRWSTSSAISPALLRSASPMPAFERARKSSSGLRTHAADPGTAGARIPIRHRVSERGPGRSSTATLIFHSRRACDSFQRNAAASYARGMAIAVLFPVISKEGSS